MFEHLAQYRILERIGADGLGTMYRARDSRAGRTVVLKVLPDSLVADAQRLAQFRRDALQAAALSHPNIAALYELGEDRGHLFVAMEYAPGATLQATLAGQPINPRRALDLAAQLADALAEAHSRAIVHRHLTPAGIIVTVKGNAKLLNVGLAEWTAGDVRAGSAEAYASPEQARGDIVDERSDIFSLGVVLFEMLTGTVSLANRPLPLELNGIIAKATAQDPGARYQSAAAFAADLREIARLLEARRIAGERRV